MTSGLFECKCRNNLPTYCLSGVQNMFCVARKISQEAETGVKMSSVLLSANS